MSANSRPGRRRFALIPSAGTGSRAGGDLPKQYQAIAGRPMLWHTAQAFLASPEIDSVLIVTTPGAQPLVQRFPDGGFEAPRLVEVDCGGDSRHASVTHGLAALRGLGAHDDDWVLVHDAARPGLTPALIARLVAAVEAEGSQAVGGILALPVADTLKRANAAQHIDATVQRDGLWQAQTPQMFPLGLLERALRDALARHRIVTDEASAIEATGHKPLLVPGALRNFKVTYPDDFALAEAILAQGGQDQPHEASQA
ncbi:2-C-methyl-D-erythritol 4-phosphate cytidylyltransferase [Ralstonia sp. A12]|uniref:2-C-methyl-D-erythritol 4-phosphate cytidylyltransferase n=1 Tax=Ralstonia sp. A12 TaxID=1217052 RepID=UPI0005744D7D|nr:2-C-methyl-D-erythritol 4-phosphate cytidylyltransferase [Ralstonia sp. A12]KHK56594.1 2-C-methyl-D-erythritol 4-phosphate cytidylyltransferase [Ralstonia sp. A12]